MIKRILITGGTGFIGSHLVEELVILGYRPIVLKRSFSNLSRILHYVDKVDFYDLDKKPLENVFKEEDIDTIINLAVSYKKNESYKDIDEMVDTNIKLPAKLLELGKDSGARLFITAGTFFHYDQNEPLINQETPVLARNFYAATKNALERLLEFYKSSSDMIVLEFILFTPYGERDDANKVIPYVIKNALQDKGIDLTAGFQRLYPTYVKDIVSLMIKAFEFQGNFGTVAYRFSVTGGQSYSIREIITVLEDILDRKIKVKWGKKEISKIDALQPLLVDISLTEKTFGWAPRTSLEEGLKRMVAYYSGDESENRKP